MTDVNAEALAYVANLPAVTEWHGDVFNEQDITDAFAAGYSRGTGDGAAAVLAAVEALWKDTTIHTQREYVMAARGAAPVASPGTEEANNGGH